MPIACPPAELETRLRHCCKGHICTAAATQSTALAFQLAEGGLHWVLLAQPAGQLLAGSQRSVIVWQDAPAHLHRHHHRG